MPFFKMGVNASRLYTISLLFLVVSSANAQTVSLANIVRIADTTTMINGFGTFRSFAFSPSINDSGSLAFYGTNEDNKEGVFRVTQSGITALAVQENFAFNSGGPVRINNGGIVVYRNNEPTENLAISASGQTSVITRQQESLDPNDPGHTFHIGASPSLTADGYAIFNGSIEPADLSSGFRTLFKRDISSPGKPIEPLVFPNTVAPGTGGLIFNGQAINGVAAIHPGVDQNGDISFSGNLRSPDGSQFFQGLFALPSGGTGSDAVLVALSGFPVPNIAGAIFNTFGLSAINSKSTVAGSGSILTNGNISVAQFRSDGRGIRVFAQTGTQAKDGALITSLTSLSLNDSGYIVYGIGVNGQSFLSSLYVDTPTGEEIRLIGVGDNFDGSTISHVSFGRDALNKNNTLAFSYGLADGRSGIAFASLRQGVSAPEPASIIFFLIGVILVLNKRQSKYTSV